MIKYNKQVAYIFDRNAQQLEYLDDSVINELRPGNSYACLYSDDVMIITVINYGADSAVRILMFRDSADYSNTLDAIKNAAPSLRFSRQNSKLIDYSRQIAAKLHDGIEISIVDVQSEDNIIECPCCGMKNEWNPAMPYCLECGEALQV